MEGSDVFFDANFNGVRDALEPSTITFGEGDYNLDIPLDLFDRNGDGKIDLTEGQIVVEKGTDTDTFQPQRFPFLTAPEWTIASPLTALALRLAQPNLAATEISLERAFALPSGFDLQADSPFIAIENGDRNGVTVLVAQGQLQNLLILGANALQAKDDRNGAANAIMAQVSQRVQSGAVLNLTDPAQVQAILNAAAQTIGASADLSEIVTEIQSRNQAIIEASGKPIEEVRAAITDNVALEAIDPSYFTIAVEPWAILLRTSQPVPPLAASSQRVLDLLDLPSIDLATFDPFTNLGNYKGVEVLTRQIQLNATLTQIADIAIGAGVENAETKVFDAIIAALQSGVQLDDLSNPEIILSVLKSVTSPGAAQRMAEIIAASNANFTTIATTAIEANNFETVRDNLVESQIIVQYLQSQLLKAIAAGEISINQFDQLMELNQTDPNMKTVIQNMIEGSDGNDTLVGTPLNDWISGRGGDDLLQGQAGDDQLYGNAGLDQLDGGVGNDYLFGGSDHDQLDGGEGDDLLDGGEGDDLLDGADGNDNLIGGLGVDSLLGNLGNDFVSGGDGNDQLNGGEGNDYLLGEAGDDAIDGGLGNDFAIGGDGRDSLDGGDGDDSLIGFADPDLLRGGTGNDLLFGNKGRDTLDGGEGDDSIAAGQKDDIVTGGVGNDYLFGNKDNDTIDGGDGDDVIYGGNQNDQLIGGAGNDTLSGDLGDDILIGQAGADVFQLRPSSGLDIIADFVAGEDSLELVGFAAEVTFADLVFSPLNGNTQLAINAEVVAIFNGAVSPTIESVQGLLIAEPQR
jgi:Ca2+-binding RTX toxin-like protein